MNTRPLLLLPIVALVATTAVAQQPVVRRASAPRPKAVTLSTSPLSVPTASFGGRPQVNVVINGKGPFPFLFDTGASGSVITPELQKELGLDAVGEARVASPAGGAPTVTSIVQIGTLELGGARVESLPMTVVSLSHLWKDGPRGVLSPAALPDVLVTMSANPGALVLERGALPAADGRTVFEWPPQERLPLIPVRIGDKTVMAHLDSGAPGGLKLPKEMATELGVAASLQETGRARMLDREITLYRAELPVAPVVAGVELPRTTTFQEGAPTANLGVEALAKLRITVDGTNRRVRVVPAGTSSSRSNDASMIRP